MSDGFDPTTIENRIRAFESFGIHRTGWPGDDETGRWLVSELAAVGVEAKTELFTFPRIEHRAARLTTPDGVIEGLPMYDGGSTPSGGLVGQLVSVADSDRFGNIVVAMPHDDGFDGFTGPATQATIQQLEADGVVAAILVSGDEDGEIIVRNAELIDHPFDLPVLQIAMKDAGDLATAILMNIEGTLEIEAERLDSTATNVVATLPGTDADAARLVHLRSGARRRPRRLARTRRGPGSYPSAAPDRTARQFRPRTAPLRCRRLPEGAPHPREGCRRVAPPRRIDRCARAADAEDGRE